MINDLSHFDFDLIGSLFLKHSSTRISTWSKVFWLLKATWIFLNNSSMELLLQRISGKYFLIFIIASVLFLFLRFLFVLKISHYDFRESFHCRVSYRNSFPSSSKASAFLILLIFLLFQRIPKYPSPINLTVKASPQKKPLNSLFFYFYRVNSHTP